MKELNEIKFNDSTVLLRDNLVKSAVLPQTLAELNRNVTVQANCVIEGAVYANRLEIQNGPVDFQGAVFANLELFINSDASEKIHFRKAVASADSVVSRSRKSTIVFGSDINAKRVSLSNAFVCGSIFADEVELDNCVVIGGVFGTLGVELKNCIVGTFNSPSVQASGNLFILLPSAFSVERISASPDTAMYNLSLADLGSLYKGLPENASSGKIRLDLDKDEVKTTLTDDNLQRTIRSYSVVGKVLAADLIDTDKFQNHFLIASASLGNQLVKSYEFGQDASGKDVVLTNDSIREFFFSILSGKIQIQDLNGQFDISEITKAFS